MSTTSQSKMPAAAKYEAFVENQLSRARQRIRLMDLSAAALGYVIVTLLYGLAVALLDSWLQLPALVRQWAFALYGVASVAYVGVTVVWPLLRRVNPYYAARQVEHVLPDAKNSVMNWLDLRDQNLPPAIRGAVSHRAAKDMARADLDEAISARRTSWLGGCALGLFLGLVVLFFMGPPRLFQRAFAPFIEAPLGTRTSLVLIQPESGDTTVAVGSAVAFMVQVEGKIPDPGKPDAVKLHFRHQATDPYEERLLERGESRREWITMVPAFEVHNGFWYKITGGDAATPEYRVQVRSTPLLTSFDVKYHYRPYLLKADETTHDPNLEALRGTEVTLLAHTNRRIRDGHLDITSPDKNQDKITIPAELVPEDPQILRFHWVMDRDATYRVWFTSTEHERNTEPMSYAIHVLQDRAPQVELTKPGEDKVMLPANGVLHLVGSAADDFGITGMALKMLIGKQEQAQPYRPGKSFRFDNGSYPQKLDYKDFVELQKIKQKNGEPLQKGIEIEYWLEAVDNCDYPEANVGRTKRYKVEITDPVQDPQKHQQEQQKAQKEQQAHQQKQDQKLDHENQEKKEQDQEKKDQEKQEQENKDQEKKDQQQKDEGQGNQPKPEDGKQPPKDPKSDARQKKLDEDLAKLNEGIKKDQDEKEKENNPGELKPDKNDQPKDNQGKGDQAKEGQPKDNPGNQGDQGKDNQDKKGEPGKQGDAGKDDPDKKKDPAKKGEPGKDNQPDNGDAAKPGDKGKDDQNKKDDQSAKGDSGKPGDKGKDDQAKKDGSGKNDPAKKDDSGKKGDPGKNDSANKGDQGKDDSAKKGDADKHGDPDKKGDPGKDDSAKKGDPAKKGEEAKPGDKGKDDQAKKGDPAKKGDQGKDDQAKKSDAAKNDPTKGDQARKGDQGKQGDQTKQGDQAKDGPPKIGEQSKNDQVKGDQADKGDADKKDQAKGDQAKGDQAKKGDPEKGDPGKKAEPGKNDQAKGDVKAEQKDGGTDPRKAEPKGDTKSKPSTLQKNESPQGENKPSASQDQPANPSECKGECKGGGKKSSSNSPAKTGSNGGSGEQGDKSDAGKKPSAEEIADLIKDLKNGDAQARQEAAKKAQDLKDAIDDPKLRKEVEKALEKSGQGKKPGDDAAKGDQAKSGSGDKGKGKAQGTDADAKADKGKAGKDDKVNDKADKSNDADDKGKDGDGAADNGKGGKENPGDSADKGKERDKSKAEGAKNAGKGDKGDSDQKSDQRGETPGKGTSGSRDEAITGNPTVEPERGEAPDPRFQKKAGALQLEDLKKKVTPDVLKKANMTEKEYQDFLRAYSEMLKRDQVEPGSDEKLANPKRTGGLRNLAVKRVEGGKGKADRLQQAGPALPPPEFREAYKEFTEKLSSERAREKK
jgi:hypothetical protein